MEDKRRTSVGYMVFTSLSSSLSVGKIMRAPVESLMRLTFAPFLPIRNLWCWGLARTSAETEDSWRSFDNSNSCCFAFSTSSFGPRITTCQNTRWILRKVPRAQNAWFRAGNYIIKGNHRKVHANLNNK